MRPSLVGMYKAVSLIASILSILKVGKDLSCSPGESPVPSLRQDPGTDLLLWNVLRPNHTAILLCFSPFLPSSLPRAFLPLFNSVSSCSIPPSSPLFQSPMSVRALHAFLSHSGPPTIPDFDLVLCPASVSSFSRRCPCLCPLASPVASSAKYFKSTVPQVTWPTL